LFRTFKLSPVLKEPAPENVFAVLTGAIRNTSPTLKTPLDEMAFTFIAPTIAGIPKNTLYNDDGLLYEEET
jgi:hypothetical protein